MSWFKRTQYTTNERGDLLINGKVASRDAVRVLLDQGGSWFDASFTPNETEVTIGSKTVGLIPANEAANNVVSGMKKKRGLF